MKKEVIRTSRDFVIKGISRYWIYGLNIFAANSYEISPLKPDLNLYKLHAIPFVKFIARFTKSYDAICIIGYPAMENAINSSQKSTSGKRRVKNIRDEIGPCHKVLVSYFDGYFMNGREYGGDSYLFRLQSQDMLKALIEDFDLCRAVALLLYPRGKDSLHLANNSLSKFDSEERVVDSILQNATHIVAIDHDAQYLSIFSKASDVEREIDEARDDATKYIVSTDWYQANAGNLVWDSEAQLCYVIKK